MLSVLATALRFTTYEDLGAARRWRFFRLAAHAGGELLSRHGVTPPSSAPAISPPSQAGTAGRASTTTRATTVAVRETDVHVAAPPPPNTVVPPANAAAPPVNRLPVPHMAPAVPTDFVDRPAEGTDLLRSLLTAAAAGERVPTEYSAVGLISSVTGVHGTGGFGKTTLAAWVCHHPEVRTAFPDGVPWASSARTRHASGSSPGRATSSRSSTAPNPRSTPRWRRPANIWAPTPQGRRVLLVVDDVWRREDEPFLRGGSGCVRLVTTRRPGVLEASAPLIRIDRMSSAQSLNLLAAGVEERTPRRSRCSSAPATGRWRSDC